MTRLTPAQKRGLALLARPGAEARTARSIFWDVLVDGETVGRIHAESLLALRMLGLVAWVRVDPLDIRQRITPRGREEAPDDQQRIIPTDVLRSGASA